MGVAEPLELLEALGHGLPLALADLHVYNQGVELDLVVDQGNLLRGVLLLNGVEIELIGEGALHGLVLGGGRLGRCKLERSLELLVAIMAVLIRLQDGREVGLL